MGSALDVSRESIFGPLQPDMRQSAKRKRRIKYGIIFGVIALWLLIMSILAATSGGEEKASKGPVEEPPPIEPLPNLPAAKHVVACIGDSLTYGAFASNRSVYSYPAQLAQMLGQPDKFDVLNLGVGMRFMRKTAPLPYWNETQYQTALNSNASTILLMLGTNDAHQWEEEAFVKDYAEMLSTLKNLTSKPKIYVMIPPPFYQKEESYHDAHVIVNTVLPKLIPQIAKDAGLPDENVINLFDALGGANLTMWEKYCDGQSCDDLHPNNAGYTTMAAHVYKSVFLKPLKSVTKEEKE